MGLRASIKAIPLLLILAHVAVADIFDVTKYGAKPNADVKQALLAAWKAACVATSPSTVVIPEGIYPLSEVMIEGPCKAPVEVQLRGTVTAPGFKQITSQAWVTFQKINAFTLSGAGTFDGMGADAWKVGGCPTCKQKPTGIRFNYVNNSMIRDITSKDAKQFHMVVFACGNVTFQNLKILAPGDSRNTDGIHLGRTSDIRILDSKIATGDDCISLGDGSQRIHIEKVTCGPGHGISIGSLGKYKNEQPVFGVTVKNCSLSDTTNGARIKTWPGSPPSVATDIHFEDLIMKNVKNPIIIEQGYCGYKHCKAAAPSKVKVSKVSFKNIRGSSASEVAIKFACSKTTPCEEVELANIDLTFKGNAAKSNITNVKPITSGKIIPALIPKP